MIFIVLPVYNEEKNIRSLLKKIDLTLKEYKRTYRIILVNDGSTDKTMETVSLLKSTIPIETITHTQNMGLGETLKTGLMHTIEISHEHDIIITMDSDNSHIPGLIMRLDRNIWEGCDVVIASRFVKKAYVIGVPWRRRILSMGASLLFRIFFPIPSVRDYTSGYRAYKTSILKSALKKFGDDFFSEPGFTCQVDILLKLRSLNPIINEVPIILRYDQRKSVSKMNVSGTIKDTIKLFCKRLAGS